MRKTLPIDLPAAVMKASMKLIDDQVAAIDSTQGLSCGGLEKEESRGGRSGGWKKRSAKWEEGRQEGPAETSQQISFCAWKPGISSMALGLFHRGPECLAQLEWVGKASTAGWVACWEGAWWEGRCTVHSRDKKEQLMEDITRSENKPLWLSGHEHREI